MPSPAVIDSEYRDKSRLELVILRDDLVLVSDPITGAVLSEFHSIGLATSWGGGKVPIRDRRQPLTAEASAEARP